MSLRVSATSGTSSSQANGDPRRTTKAATAAGAAPAEARRSKTSTTVPAVVITFSTTRTRCPGTSLPPSRLLPAFDAFGVQEWHRCLASEFEAEYHRARRRCHDDVEAGDAGRTELSQESRTCRGTSVRMLVL